MFDTLRCETPWRASRLKVLNWRLNMELISNLEARWLINQKHCHTIITSFKSHHASRIHDIVFIFIRYIFHCWRCWQKVALKPADNIGWRIGGRFNAFITKPQIVSELRTRNRRKISFWPLVCDHYIHRKVFKTISVDLVKDYGELRMNRQNHAHFHWLLQQ